MASFLSLSQSIPPWLILVLIAELIMKGIALWKAARNNQKYWFVGMLIINTAGILPLAYILGFQHKK